MVAVRFHHKFTFAVTDDNDNKIIMVMRTSCSIQTHEKIWKSFYHFAIHTLLILPFVVTIASSAFHSNAVPFWKRSTPRDGGRRSMSYDEGEQQQTLEVIQSLVEFHEGTWTGQATSFTVTPDVAAGVVQRKTSPPYQTSIKVGTHTGNSNGSSNNNINKVDFGFTETFAWEDKLSSRQISFAKSNFDVDSVDASYSFDFTWPDLPSALTGTDKLISFGMEHCLATSEEERVRCLVFYGVDQSLARVVVMNERKVPQSSGGSANWFTSSDLQQDVDRIVDKITDRVYKGNATGASVMPSMVRQPQAVVSATPSSSAQPSSYPTLTRHPINLMELTSGLWLGDSVIRDLPWVPMTPPTNGRGFVSNGNNNNENSNNMPLQQLQDIENYNRNAWPAWSMGVQKVARQWWWDFGETVRQVTDVGKSLGAELATSSVAPSAMQQQTGFVCVNESMSRRIPKDERMVYMDWNGGTHVGFLLGSVSIQVRIITSSDSCKVHRGLFP